MGLAGAHSAGAKFQPGAGHIIGAHDQGNPILGVLGAADSAEAERSARTLASLARALKEVMRLAAPEQASDPDEDDPVPRDLDEFRRELARRIEALAAEAEGQAAGDGG